MDIALPKMKIGPLHSLGEDKEKKLQRETKFLFIWLLDLLITATLTAVTCHSETVECDDWYNENLFETIEGFFLKSLLTFYVARVSRTAALKKWYFYVSLVSSALVFGFIPLPGLYFRGHHWPDEYTTSIVCTLIFMLGLFIIHTKWAFNLSTAYGYRYLFSAILGIAFYCVMVAISTENFKIAFHHYQIAWIISLFMRFNKWPSILGLGISVGVFIQGLVVYGHDWTLAPL